MTMWLALARLGVVGGGTGPRELVVHVVGADYVEAKRDAALEGFRALLALVGEASPEVQRVLLLLVGPNVPVEADGVTATVELGTLVAELRMERAEYHASASLADARWAAAHAAFCFNAGVWGYDSWAPTLAFLHKRGTPTIVTSYNALEADDDFDSISAAAPFTWAWGPEENPFRSLSHRPSGIEERTCCENHHWQCMIVPAQAPARGAASV